MYKKAQTSGRKAAVTAKNIPSTDKGHKVQAKKIHKENSL